MRSLTISRFPPDAASCRALSPDTNFLGFNISKSSKELII